MPEPSPGPASTSESITRRPPRVVCGIGLPTVRLCAVLCTFWCTVADFTVSRRSAPYSVSSMRARSSRIRFHRVELRATRSRRFVSPTVAKIALSCSSAPLQQENHHADHVTEAPYSSRSSFTVLHPPSAETAHGPDLASRSSTPCDHLSIGSSGRSPRPSASSCWPPSTRRCSSRCPSASTPSSSSWRLSCGSDRLDRRAAGDRRIARGRRAHVLDGRQDRREEPRPLRPSAPAEKSSASGFAQAAPSPWPFSIWSRRRFRSRRSSSRPAPSK